MADVEPIVIESLDDPRVSDYAGLRDRKESDEFLIAESAIVVERLLSSPFTVRSFFFTPKGWQRMRDVVLSSPRRAPVYVAEPEVMEAVTGFDLHRGILAAANRRGWPSVPDVASRARRLIVLEGSNDHENIGVIARSARGLGFDALLLSPDCADPYYRRCVRVSMGEILHLPVTRMPNWPDSLDYLRQRGFQLWALTPDAGATNLFTMGMPDKVALLAGAEGPGLTPAAAARADHAVRIPMHRDVDSLNLGHAVAIAMAAVSPPVDG